jgi:hypothetical protein
VTPERSLFWLCLPDLALAVATLTVVFARLFAAADPRTAALFGLLAGHLLVRGWLTRDWFSFALLRLLILVELACHLP